MFGMQLIVERDSRTIINWRAFAIVALVAGWSTAFAFLGVVYAFDLDRNLFRLFFPAMLVLSSLSGIPLRRALRRRSPAGNA
jgi:uncharacterized membrane protein YfcA